MDSKRKANGAAASVETDDRAAKRRKLALIKVLSQDEYDLSKGETRESTTAYGMAFLEQLRRTADKGGRLVATYFEKLPPRDGNAEYYKQTRMPISLELIEKKLNNGEFENLAKLESYFKRMIANAKEFYPRSSTTFDDAERIRKALSNYMTKTNPAYHNRGYQAMPTPLPPEDSNEAEADEDAEGEENSEDVIEEADNDENEEEDDEEEAKEEEEEEEEEEPSSRRRTITLKRRGPGRPSTSRRASTRVKEPPKSAAPSIKPDHQYEDVPYKGLSFYEAQEKVVEELLRHRDPEYEDAYFEPFINLPPRALKDYYKVITDPLSIKKLQKMVKGMHSRGETTGASDFKTWSAFGEKAKLLWTNAYFYNEEGSEIYALAQELEEFFGDQFKQAQAAVPEPSQPKIKLKVGQSSDTPTPSGKKITIHVGGQRDSGDSPAPVQQTGTATNGQNVNGTSTPALSINPQLEKARSVSASVPSPSPSIQGALKAEDISVPSSAGVPQPPSVASAQGTPGANAAPIPAVQPPPVIHNPLANGYMEQRHPRRPGKGVKDALIESVRIQVHPGFQSHSPTLATVRPDPFQMRQSVTINLSPHLNRILVVPAIPEHLHDRQYSLWTLFNKQPLKPIHHQAPGQQPNEHAFETVLHHGVNSIEVHLIAAIPRNERVPGGPEVELEIFTILVNMLRN
ncbi:polybromo-1 [Fusarium albosuccineum]|uniref:Polybromo-1 n=1 Tax=Fusarium albosuccineum TaxID=1237068 RepID=A0A8H4LHX1_9HYPO|nr:polybromo-1 [Fusarium albosuccineum]